MARAPRNENIDQRGTLATIAQGEAVYTTIRHQAYCYMHVSVWCVTIEKL
jgi:hypothetical protein